MVKLATTVPPVGGLCVYKNKRIPWLHPNYRWDFIWQCMAQLLAVMVQVRWWLTDMETQVMCQSFEILCFETWPTVHFSRVIDLYDSVQLLIWRRGHTHKSKLFYQKTVELNWFISTEKGLYKMLFHNRIPEWHGQILTMYTTIMATLPLLVVFSAVRILPSYWKWLLLKPTIMKFQNCYLPEAWQM